MSSRVHNAPIEPGRWGAEFLPHYKTKHRTSDQLEMTQNIFRMWRDFPSLRFGQFLANALGPEPTPDLFNIEDEEIHQKLYDFWLNHSKKGQALLARQQEALERKAGRDQSVEDAEVVGPGGCTCKRCQSSDPDRHTRCAHCCPYRE